MLGVGPEWPKSGVHMGLYRFEVKGVQICGAGKEWQKSGVH